MAALTSTWLSHALYYRSLGLSVFPLRPHDKRPFPGFGWKEFQRRIATEAELHEWAREYPDANLAIVCGKISGNLEVYDVDNLAYRDFLLPTLEHLDSPTIQTGSGKIHILLRSRIPQGTTAHNLLSQRLADIKSEGSYIVAPPSIHPDTGKPYEVKFGTFESIKLVDTARKVYDKLYAIYAGRQYRDPDDEEGSYKDTTILAPLTGLDLAAMTERIERTPLHPRLRRQITHPPKKTDAYWSSKSYSELDFSVCCSLVEAGFKDPEIEEIFASFPIGEGCYQASSRPNHGHGYLLRTLDNVRKRLDERLNAEAQDLGLNFRVLSVKRLEMEKTVYELTIETRSGEHTVSIVGDDLFKKDRTTTVLGVALNLVPRFPAKYDGKGWDLFTETIMSLANREDVPEEATTLGLIRFYILKVLGDTGTKGTSALPSSAPLEKKDLNTGWIDHPARIIYVNGSKLVSLVSSEMRPPPGPERVWQAVRSLRGNPVSVILASGERVDVWELPLEVLAR